MPMDAVATADAVWSVLQRAPDYPGMIGLNGPAELALELLNDRDWPLLLRLAEVFVEVRAAMAREGLVPRFDLLIEKSLMVIAGEQKFE